MKLFKEKNRACSWFLVNKLITETHPFLPTIIKIVISAITSIAVIRQEKD